MQLRASRRATHLALALVTLFILGAFFTELVPGRVYYPGDTARVYLPQRTALQHAIQQNTLPWWTTGIGAGYPLLAEGQVAALYPLNWLLYSLLPVEIALTVSVVLHYLITGVGFYVYARTLRLSRAAAYLGALVWTLGGFTIAHLSHVSIMAAAAWLPWLFALTHALLRPTNPARWFPWPGVLALALVTGLQFLAGHPQISLLSMMALAAYALFLGLTGNRQQTVRAWSCWVAALVLGIALALPQLVPTFELSALSQRAGGLDSAFFTSYSFHPFLLATYLSPFLLGNPYPTGSVELMGYVGLLPLVLAGVALWRWRGKEKWFFAGLILVGALLAFGRWNPLYGYLRYVPLFNLFRVPARYLYWVSLGLAVLTALGFDAIRASFNSRARAIGVPLLAALLVAILALVWVSPTADDLVAAWRWIPLLLSAALLVLLGLGQRFGARLWPVAACALLLVDLYAYGAVLDQTYNATLPLEEVVAAPASLDFLRQDDSLYRLYTKEEIMPALSVMRESHYPNMALTHDLDSANTYMPLVPVEYERYLQELDAQRLNRLNVKYYLIPQLLPVDEARELYDVHNPFAALPVNTWLDIPLTEVSALDVESFLSHAADLPDGTLVAELLLADSAGHTLTFPLRAGIETAEWAYERSDVQANIAHSMPETATTWPSRSGAPPEDHPGHTYLARFAPGEPFPAVRVMLRLHRPEAFVRVERVRLHTANGEEQLLSHLLGLGDHSIVYRSEDVLIYRNNDAFPRAYALPAAALMATERGLVLAQSLTSSDLTPVEVVQYEEQYIRLRANLEAVGYVILADLHYPGWVTEVDGAPAPITPVDGVFRAVAVSPGTHEIVFRYRPWFLRR
jgi:hypothetical protein